ncbi:MAG: GAF domain-containing protein [Nitrospinae bacterium]|nr:GAF domain-containing protein [Nitrospinota bacterium]
MEALGQVLEDKLDLIRGVCKIANSSPDLKQRLQMIVNLVSEKLQADCCSVFLLDDFSGLVLKASKGLHPDSVDQVKLKVGEGITGTAVAEKKTIFTRNAPSHPKYVYLPITGEEQFQSIISTPILSDGECIGVINVHTKDQRDFSPVEIQTLETLAGQLSGIIKISYLYEKNAGSLRELSLIQETGRKISSILTVPELINAITQGCREIIQADCSALWLRDESSGEFIKKCSAGPDADSQMKQHFDICGPDHNVSGHGCRVDVSSILPVISGLKPKITCSLDEEIRGKYCCFPLLSQSNLLGMLSVYREKPHSRISHYSESEMRLLALLASQAGLAIDNALTHDRLKNLNEKSLSHLRELNILYEATQAMGTNMMNLDKCLRMALNAVTVGDGLGFNRAILLLLNDDGSMLQGMMGVGPDSAREAGEIWERVSRQKKPDLSEWLIQNAEEPLKKKSYFNDLAKSLRFPVNPAECILSRTIAEKKPFNVKNAANDKYVKKDLLVKLGCRSFATAPLMAGEKALGVILVDNLYSGAPITDSDLQFLSHFGSQAGWAIQNSSIFTKLEEVNKDLFLTQKRLSDSEHFAVLGELSAEIAHEIKNPLVPIGGFARRLFHKLEKESPSRKYARIIVDEVARLELLLSNVLNYSKKIEPVFSPGNLNKAIEDIIHLMKEDIEENNIRLICNLGNDVPDTYFDPNQMKQVVSNLVSNAIESMAEAGGELKISTFRDDGHVILKFADTGGGMSEDTAKNMFNPFFTTKKYGTGIGLPLVKKIVENHKGKIGVENLAGTGLILTLILPCETK